SAAVIGGTSLFGGRGEVRSALIGALVIATVSNGLDTAGYQTGAIYIGTRGILLAARPLATGPPPGHGASGAWASLSPGPGGRAGSSAAGAPRPAGRPGSRACGRRRRRRPSASLRRHRRSLPGRQCADTEVCRSPR